MQYSIIGDVAGNVKTLQALWAKLNPTSHKILVGDLFDRGPDSKGVWTFLKDREDCTILYGNHEDFLIRSITSEEQWQRDLWLKTWVSPNNGGLATLKSFSVDGEIADIPLEVVSWFESFRLFYEDKEAGLIVTHAPLAPGAYETLTKPNFDKKLVDLMPLIWNRSTPEKIPGILQVFGHNTFWEEYKDEEDLYAVCIDNCGRSQMTALEMPSGKYISQVIID